MASEIDTAVFTIKEHCKNLVQQEVRKHTNGHPPSNVELQEILWKYQYPVRITLAELIEWSQELENG